MELRSLLSGSSLLDDSGLYATPLDGEDVHASPISSLSLAQMLASNLGQQDSSNSNAASTDANTNDPPVADPLVQGVLGSVSIVLEDLQGTPITQITAGQDFKLKVMVQDIRTDPSGFFSAYIGVSFDPAIVSLVDTGSLAVDPYYSDLEVQTDIAAGKIRAGGGSSNFNQNTLPHGNSVLLWSVTLHAEASGTADFATSIEDFSDVLQFPVDTSLLLETDPLTADNLNLGTAQLSVVGQPAVSISDVSQLEGDTPGQNYVFTVSLSEASDQQVTVAYTTENGTATAGQDYLATSGTLTFDAGVVQRTVTVNVTGDLTNEADETFSVLLSGPVNAVLGTDTATGTIQNDDDRAISIASVTQDEGNEQNSMVFTLTLSKVAGEDVTVQFATQDGAATVGNNDYQATSGTATFIAGSTMAFVTVTINGDTTVENNEDFQVVLSNPVGAALATSSTATGTLLNDDGGTLSFSPASVTQPEGNTNNTMVFTVTLSATNDSPVTVAFSTADGTALAGSDYEATSGTLTFAGGSTESQLVTVTILGDTVDESDESFSLVLSSPENASIAQGTATGNITNDDVHIITISPTTQAEGDVQNTMLFTVTLSQASSNDITVAYATQDGTATLANNDYTATSGTLTFIAGETMQVLTVVVNGDTTVEPNETFQVLLSNPVGGQFDSTSNVATGTITNDDIPTLTITPPANTNEDANSGHYVLTATLSAAFDQDITVAWSTADGTATAPGDYATTSGTLSFAAGETTTTFTVNVVVDTVQEPDETFQINLTNPTNVEVPQPIYNATITNDDGVPAISIQAPAAQNEGDSGYTPFVFTVTLSNASQSPVTVAYTTVDGIATVADNDYTAASGTLTFAKDQTTQTITVLVTGDTRVENANETFRVDLSNPVGATLQSGTRSPRP